MPPLPEDWTMYIRIWTGQKCQACGSEFHYVRRFTVPRSQTEYDATAAGIEAEYVQAAKDTAELFPCPHCGYIQPDMVGTRKAVSHGVFTFAAFLLLLINTMSAAFGVLPNELAMAIAVGIAGAALLFHGYQVFANPNRDRMANLTQAQEQIQKGRLRLVKSGAAAVFPSLPLSLRAYLGAAGILLLAGVTFYLPALIDLPFWICQVAGIILFIWSGSTFANIALRLKAYANPREIVEVNATQVTDESVPEDFQKK